MSDSTSNLDLLVTGQAGKESTANALIDAESPAAIFGRRASTTSALTWGYYGGMMVVDGVLTAIANGTVALTASLTNYVEATRAGVVSANTTGFTAGRIPLYTVVAGASTVTSYIDDRAWATPMHLTSSASVAVTTADITLTQAQAACGYLITTGTLTGNRSVITPDNWHGEVFCNNAGAFTTTFKTAAGTGKVVTQGKRAVLRADGTNVERITADV